MLTIDTIHVTLQTSSQWQIIFYISASIYIVGAVLYVLLASGDRQAWADIPSGYAPHVDEDEEESQAQGAEGSSGQEGMGEGDQGYNRDE